MSPTGRACCAHTDSIVCAGLFIVCFSNPIGHQCQRKKNRAMPFLSACRDQLTFRPTTQRCARYSERTFEAVRYRHSSQWLESQLHQSSRRLRNHPRATQKKKRCRSRSFSPGAPRHSKIGVRRPSRSSYTEGGNRLWQRLQSAPRTRVELRSL